MCDVRVCDVRVCDVCVFVFSSDSESLKAQPSWQRYREMQNSKIIGELTWVSSSPRFVEAFT